MQDEDDIWASNSVNGSIGIGIEGNDDLDYSSAAIAFKCFRIRVFPTLLRQAKCVTCDAFGADWERTKITFAGSNEYEWRRWAIGQSCGSTPIHVIPVQVYSRSWDYATGSVAAAADDSGPADIHSGYCTGVTANVDHRISVASAIPRYTSRLQRNAPEKGGLRGCQRDINW